MKLNRPGSAVFMALLLFACGKEAPPPAAKAPAPTAPPPPAVSTAMEWDGFVDQFIEEYLAAHPAFAVVQGRHEYDGQLPDWSRAGIEREIDRLHSQRNVATAYPDSSLTDEQQYQRDYLVSRIDHDLFWLEKADWPFRNPAFYFGWLSDSLDPSPYVTLTYAPPVERLKAVIGYLESIPAAAEQIRANLATPMPLTWVEYGIAAFGGLADYFDNELVEAFAGIEDPELLHSFDSARARAAADMNGVRTWLEGERMHATADFALGPDLFLEMVRDTEGIDTTLEELEAVARADLKRNTEALKAACGEFAPGRGIRECFAKMADNKPEGGAVEAARAQLEGLKQHVIEQDLVSIPAEEEAQVREAPPFARLNFAYINIPGPFERGQPSIYFIAPPDPAWPDEVQHAYVPGKADLLFTSVHEIWPGHFLNLLHAKQSEWIFGRIFVGYAYAEGWAHYTEELMVETGLGDGDPEIRIGQLSNALLRNVRFLSALGLHTQGMSVAESEKLFMETGFQDEGTAKQQAARGTYDPAYLNYNMGKLLIRQLREDWTRDRGGREAWKAFHDAFLSYGGPPIPLVRAQMLGGEPEAVFWTE